MKKNLSILLGAFCSIFFIILMEPNSLCVTDGKIIEIVGTTCDLQTNKDCDDRLKRISYRFSTKFSINYSTNGNQETTILSPLEIRTWMGIAQHQLPPHLQNDRRKVFFGDIAHQWEPYVGCKVKVYHLRGQWFGDKSWLDPIADISMCRKPLSQK